MGLNASVNRPSRPLADEQAARNYCLWLLGRREYSRAELITKMCKRSLERSVAIAVVDRLVEAGLQSDLRCAEAVQRGGARRGWSKRRILLKLRTQGIDVDQLEGFELLDSESESKRSKELFDAWMAKTDGSRKSKQKVLARLARRGFPVGHLFSQ